MKKALSLLLVLVLAMGMSTVAFAYEVAAETAAGPFGFNRLQTAAGGLTTVGEIDLGDNIDPDTADTFFAILGDGFDVDFENDNEENVLASSGTFIPWRAAKDIKLRTRVSKGSPAIRDVQWLERDATGFNKVAGIRIRYAQRLKTIDEDGVEFEFTVYPTVDGDTWDYEDKGMVFTGTVVNELVEIDGGTRYVDLYNHVIAQAEEAVSDIDYDLGPDENDHTVIVHGRAANGASYYGYSTTTSTAAQDKLMSEHDIDVVYNLDYIGLDRVAKYVTLAVDPETYVYDADLKPLGRGNSELPLSKVYYVSYHEIVAEEEPEPEEPELALPAPPADTGGWGAPEGPFENPSTGA